jgi:putative ubiquitin-RnfH superfamily antitoxin RatB of RatAB toxin-antitoxin module
MAEPAVLVVHVPAQGPALELPVPHRAGLTVRQALLASGLGARCPEIDLGEVRCGVWGKPREPDALVEPGERVEVYRPLRADPKASRAARARKKAEAKAGGVAANKNRA